MRVRARTSTRCCPARWRRRNPVVTSIGRLDKDTSGLLLLTDQSELVHRLTSPTAQGAEGLPRHGSIARRRAMRSARFASGALHARRRRTRRALLRSWLCVTSARGSTSR
jgi:hypothetical protein